jgi:hypothetical protein
MSVVIAYYNDLVSNNIGCTMTQVNTYLQSMVDKIVVIDEEHFKDLNNDIFGREAIFAVYKYISEHPEQKIYIVFLVERSYVIGQYVGHTAPKTMNVLDKLDGKTVLFHKSDILLNGNDSFGQEAITTINAYIRSNNKRRIFYI